MKFPVLTIQQFQDQSKNLLPGSTFTPQAWVPVIQAGHIKFYVLNSFTYLNVSSPLNEVKFKWVGNGNFNLVWEFHDPTRKNLKSVFKVTITDAMNVLGILNKNKDDEAWCAEYTANHYKRSVDLWNDINGSKIAPAYTLVLNFQDGVSFAGWGCEYIRPLQAVSSPSLLCYFLFEICQKTGRVVVDIATNGNVGRTESGDLVCLDVSFALKLIRMQEVNAKRQMELSLTSMEYWANMRECYLPYFDDFRTTTSTHYSVIEMIKALLFLQEIDLDMVEFDRLGFSEIYKYKIFLAECYERPEEGVSFFDKIIYHPSFPTNLREKILGHFSLDSDLKRTGVDYLTRKELLQNPIYSLSHVREFCRISDKSENKTQQEIDKSIKNFCKQEMRIYRRQAGLIWGENAASLPTTILVQSSLAEGKGLNVGAESTASQRPLEKRGAFYARGMNPDAKNFYPSFFPGKTFSLEALADNCSSRPI